MMYIISYILILLLSVLWMALGLVAFGNKCKKLKNNLFLVAANHIHTNKFLNLVCVFMFGVNAGFTIISFFLFGWNGLWVLLSMAVWSIVMPAAMSIMAVPIANFIMRMQNKRFKS